MKSWKVTFELFYDASIHDSVVVKANTQRKAIIYATQKMQDKAGTDMVRFVSIEPMF